MSFELSKRLTKRVADLDKYVRFDRYIPALQHYRDLLDGLHNRGFKTNIGYQGTGLRTLFWNKGGGYYIGVPLSIMIYNFAKSFIGTGASQLIIDGHIKLKSGSLIKELTEDGIKFEDGTSIPADIIICATGLVFLTSLYSHAYMTVLVTMYKPL